MLGVGEQDYLCQQAISIGIKTIHFPSLGRSINPNRDWKSFTSITSFIENNDIDLVHAHSSKAGILGRIAAAHVNKPAIFTAHGWGFATGIPLWRRFVAISAERLAAKYCERIITVSDYDRALAKKYRVACGSKILTIHNGISDIKNSHSPIRNGSSPLTLSMIARFSQQKDHITLLHALKRIDVSCQLQLIGDGPTKNRAERVANRLGLDKGVNFMGSRHDIVSILDRTHVMTLISKWEGLPISIIEAMRAGLPVVATNVGGVSELVVNNETGLLVKRGSVDDLAVKLSLILNSNELRTRYGIAARIRFENSFTVDKMLQKTKAVYYEVLSKRSV